MADPNPEALADGAYFVSKSIPNGSAVDGDCCVCCGRTTILLKGNPEEFPASERIKRRGPFGWGETCYCNCCACYPDSDLNFSMIQCLKETSVLEPYLPCDATMDFTLTQGAEHCFTTQAEANAFISAGGGGGGACSSYNSQTETYYEGLEYTIDGGEGVGRYPEAWGYSGKVCTDRGTLPERPSSNWPEGRGEPGMEVISSLCCCKISTSATPNQGAHGHGHGKLVPASGGNPGPLPANCQPLLRDNPLAGADKYGGPNATSACSANTHGNDLFGGRYGGEMEPQGADPLINRRYECSIPCFVFTIQPNPIITGSYLISKNLGVEGALCDGNDDDFQWAETGYFASPCSRDFWRLGGCRMDGQGKSWYMPSWLENGTMLTDDNTDKDFFLRTLPTNGGSDWDKAKESTMESPAKYGGQNMIVSGQCPDGKGKQFMLLVAGAWMSHCDCASGQLDKGRNVYNRPSAYCSEYGAEGECSDELDGGGLFYQKKLDNSIQDNSPWRCNDPRVDYPNHPEQPGGWTDEGNLLCQEPEEGGDKCLSLCEQISPVLMFFTGLIN